MVNYENSVKKPFTDLGKLVIGILISIVPFVNWIAQGFIIESSGFGKTKPSMKMPEWKEWASLFFKGFASFVIGFVYAIPALLVLLLGAGMIALSLAGSLMGSGISGGMIASALGSDAAPGALRDLISQNLYLAL